MDGFEHGRVSALRVYVAAGRQAHAAGDYRADVGENVAEQVAADDHVERLRAADEVHAGGVYEQRIGFHVGVFGGDSVKRPVPHQHPVAERVGFGYGSDMLGAISRAGGVEGVANDALASSPREYAGLDADFLRESGIEKAAHVGVLALRVFADHQHVYVAGGVALDWRFDAFVEDARSLADVLVERATDGQQQPTERYVVLKVRVSDRAEEDGVRFGERIKRVGRHDDATLAVEFASPRTLVPRPFDAVLAPDGV